jgi:CHAD domain-containing protein
MARSRPVEGLSPSHSFQRAAVAVVTVRARELFDHSSGVLDTADIERVHDMRVASRRLRAALEVFRPCFPKKQLRRVLAEVKALADALGERRDADVAIAATEQLQMAMGAGEQAGVLSFVRLLRAEQIAANEKLAHTLAGKRLESLRSAIDDMLAEAREDADRTAAQATTAAHG